MVDGGEGVCCCHRGQADQQAQDDLFGHCGQLQNEQPALVGTLGVFRALQPDGVAKGSGMPLCPPCTRKESNEDPALLIPGTPEDDLPAASNGHVNEGLTPRLQAPANATGVPGVWEPATEPSLCTWGCKKLVIGLSKPRIHTSFGV